MITAWTRNLADKDIPGFEKQLRNSIDVLDRLAEILTEDLQEIENVEAGLKQYDTPSWSHKQAHLNGERSRIRKMLKLINLDRKERK